MPSKVRWLYIIPGSGNILVRCNKDIKVLDKSGSELASTESESNHGCLLSPSGKYLFSSPIWGDLLKTQDLKSAGIKKDRSVRILTRCFHPRHDDLYTIYRTRKGDRKAWIEKTNELGETVSKVPLSALSKDRFPSGRSAISPNEKWIVFSGPHPTVYDLSTGEWKCDLMDRPSGTKRFIFSDDGRWLISEGDAENAVFDFANLISTEEEN